MIDRIKGLLTRAGVVVLLAATGGWVSSAIQPEPAVAGSCEFDRCEQGKCVEDGALPQNCDMKPGNVGCDVTECGVQ